MMKKNQHSGFTLLELSFVLLILSLMLGGILAISVQNTRIEKRKQLDEKMLRIRNAMMDFRLAYKRLPCPGDITLLVTSSNFGREGDSPGDCAGGALASNYATAGSAVYGGSVPVRTLGLTDEDAYDPWGNMLLYVVDKNITLSSLSNPFATYPPTHATIGNITVRDGEGDTITSRALYLILSHGQNAHGAYMRSGVRKSTGSVNTMEQMNCHCDDTLAATPFTAIFYKAFETTSSTNALNSFDDKVMFVMRNEMLSAAEAEFE